MTPRDLSFLRYPGVVVRGEVFESKESAVLLEDLVEVELPSGKFIDLGWYPEHDVNGEYVVRLWSRDDPKSEESFRTPDLDRALRRIERLVVSHRRVDSIDTEVIDRAQDASSTGHDSEIA